MYLLTCSLISHLDNKRITPLFQWSARFIRKRKIFAAAISVRIESLWKKSVVILGIILTCTALLNKQSGIAHGAVVELSSGVLEGHSSIISWGKLYIAFFKYEYVRKRSGSILAPGNYEESPICFALLKDLNFPCSYLLSP